MQLEKRVFSKKEFTEAAGKNFVLLEVDFPNSKEQTDEVKKQNEKLSKDFAIEAFPTLLVCDAQGRPYAELGFPEEMTPEGMVKELAATKEVKAKRDAAFAAAEKAEGVDKAQHLVAALKLVPPAAIPSAYAKSVDEIAKSDPDDKTGFVKDVRSQQAMAALEAKFSELMGEEKYEEAIKYVDGFIKEHQLAGEPKQKAMLFKLFGFASMEKNADAVKIAEEIIAIDAESETAMMATQLKRQLE